MRRWWDIQAFSGRASVARNHDDNDHAVEINAFHVAVQDELFWRYCGMLRRLFSVIQHLFHWCEGCPCHRSATMYAGDVREALQREVKCRCMLAGRRAPELAAGELERFLDCIQAQQSAALMDTLKDLLPTKRDAITGDFDKGCS